MFFRGAVAFVSIYVAVHHHIGSLEESPWTFSKLCEAKHNCIRSLAQPIAAGCPENHETHVSFFKAVTDCNDGIDLVNFFGRPHTTWAPKGYLRKGTFSLFQEIPVGEIL